MAALGSQARQRIAAHFMRVWDVAAFGGIAVDKVALRAAIDATDDWIDANQTAFNNALPQPFRGTVPISAKTLLFCLVAMRRAGRLRTEEDDS